MKFALSTLLAAAIVSSASGTYEGAVCQVEWVCATKPPYKCNYVEVAGWGCGGDTGLDRLECDYDIYDNATDTIMSGSCNYAKCFGSLDNKKSVNTGTDRVTICHRTCSRKNPWVRINFYDDAWKSPEKCGH